MSILFHCTWHDSKEWLQKFKKRFKGNKIYTLKNKPDLSKIESAFIWELNNNILKQMVQDFQASIGQSVNRNVCVCVCVPPADLM